MNEHFSSPVALPPSTAVTSASAIVWHLLGSGVEAAGFAAAAVVSVVGTNCPEGDVVDTTELLAAFELPPQLLRSTHPRMRPMTMLGRPAFGTTVGRRYRLVTIG